MLASAESMNRNGESDKRVNTRPDAGATRLRIGSHALRTCPLGSTAPAPRMPTRRALLAYNIEPTTSEPSDRTESTGTTRGSIRTLPGGSVVLFVMAQGEVSIGQPIWR